MTTFWQSWLYHYGVGGVILTAAFFVMLRSGALRMSQQSHRRMLLAMIAGPILFMTVHGLWIALASR